MIWGMNFWTRILYVWFMILVIQWPVECEGTECWIDTSWYFKILMSTSVRISIQGQTGVQQRWPEVLQEILEVQSLPSTWIVTWKRHVSLPEQKFHLETIHQIQAKFQDWKLSWFHWIIKVSECEENFLQLTWSLPTWTELVEHGTWGMLSKGTEGPALLFRSAVMSHHSMICNGWKFGYKK